MKGPHAPVKHRVHHAKKVHCHPLVLHKQVIVLLHLRHAFLVNMGLLAQRHALNVQLESIRLSSGLLVAVIVMKDCIHLLEQVIVLDAVQIV
jgi:hypothetical protein